jgi:hypothetical protein
VPVHDFKAWGLTVGVWLAVGVTATLWVPDLVKVPLAAEVKVGRPFLALKKDFPQRPLTVAMAVTDLGDVRRLGDTYEGIFLKGQRGESLVERMNLYGMTPTPRSCTRRWAVTSASRRRWPRGASTPRATRTRTG